MSDYTSIGFNLSTFQLSTDQARNSARGPYSHLRDGWFVSNDPIWLLDALERATRRRLIFQDLDIPLRRFAIWCAAETAGRKFEEGKILWRVREYVEGRVDWGNVCGHRGGAAGAAGGAMVCGVSRGSAAAAALICGIAPANEDPFGAARTAMQWAWRSHELNEQATGTAPSFSARDYAVALRRCVPDPFDVPAVASHVAWVPPPIITSGFSECSHRVPGVQK